MLEVHTDVLIVGSGAGAIACLSELVNSGKHVTVAERGNMNANMGEGVIERGKRIYQENGSFPSTIEGLAYYRRLGVGGTVDVSCANGILPPNNYLSSYNFDIETELNETSRWLGIKPVPESHLGPNTNRLTDAASILGYEMTPMPKFIDFKKCNQCALCELICSRGAVWSAKRKLTELASLHRVSVLDDVTINKIEINGDRATAALGTKDETPIKITADTFILAAGGLGTPVILQNSGVEAGKSLFLDLYVVVYGQSPHFTEKREIPMTTVYAHPDNSFVIAPYIDIDLWYALNTNNLGSWLTKGNIYGLMVKIADDTNGYITSDGKVHKQVTDADRKKLDIGISIAKEILLKSGVQADTISKTNVRGAHPGATAAYGSVVDERFRVKGITNLHIADASILPEALGKPPIVTIMALAKKMAKSLVN